MDSRQRQSLARIAPWLLAALIFAGGILATALYWQHTTRLEQSALESRFAADTNRIVANLTQQLDHYEVVMRGLRGLYQASEYVEHDEFLRYNDALEVTAELTGVQAVAFVKAVQPAQLEAFRARMAEELPSSFQLWPTGERPLYAPISYIDPLTEANRKAVGFDILTNPTARRAAFRARDTGEAAMTAPLSLIQDGEASAGTSFVMYLPVYKTGAAPGTVEQRRAALVGWIDLPFRMADLMAGLEGLIPADIELTIRDPAAPDDRQILFDSASETAGASRDRTLQATREIPIADRRWEIRMNTTPAYRASMALPRRSTLISLAGFAVSALLAALVCMIATGRNRSERRAARLGQLYHALSEVNQAIVRMDSEKGLFQLVCDMAVHYGGLKMAWISQMDSETGTIQALASAGTGTDYIAALSGARSPSDISSPTFESIRRDEPVIVNDYMADERTRAYRKQARTFGWKSCGIFPIPRGGEPYAVLIVYQDRVNAFDEDVVNLLRELASDVSFGLDNFDREAQRQRYEEALAESEQQLSTIIENVGACIFLKDRQGRYTFANQRVLDLMTCEESEIIGAGDERFFAGDSLPQIRDNDRRVLERGEILQEEEKVRLKAEDTPHIFWSVKIPLRRPDGTIHALCGIATDVTELKAQEERVRYLSNYDALTGLPNRDMLRERTRLALAAAAEHRSHLSLLCINLDRFKLINDSLGHGIGDQVLQTLAERMASHLHLNATLSRLGSDDFILLLPATDADQARDIVQQLQEVIAAPIVLDEHRLVVTASIGIASYPRDGDDFDQLIQCADAALLKAKQQGPNQCEVFTPVMRVDVNESLRIENDLREALARDQLVLHYQPQVDIRTGAITGVEALVRWQHPVHGLVSPAQFIPVAEKTGLIIDIGYWVMETAVRQHAAWRSMGLPIESVSVNLSMTQLYSNRLLDNIDQLLATHTVPPGTLELELTESIAMEHSARTLETLKQLQSRGIALAIDDFGTGYSSLSYLKRYPVQTIKIDRSFVDDVDNDPEDQAIVLAILGVARGLGFRTIAEGVETAEQLDFLRHQGCDSYQGFYFSRPVPAEAITQLLKRVSGSS